MRWILCQRRGLAPGLEMDGQALMRILAVDPGKTTGWVIYQEGEDLEFGQSAFEPFVKKVERVQQGISSYIDTIVCERFTINTFTTKNSNQTDALEVIGYLKSVAVRYQTRFLLQMPSSAKTFATDERLKDAGLYIVGQDHARDAARHLLLYLTQKGLYAPS